LIPTSSSTPATSPIRRSRQPLRVGALSTPQSSSPASLDSGPTKRPPMPARSSCARGPSTRTCDMAALDVVGDAGFWDRPLPVVLNDWLALHRHLEALPNLQRLICDGGMSRLLDRHGPTELVQAAPAMFAPLTNRLGAAVGADEGLPVDAATLVRNALLDGCGPAPGTLMTIGLSTFSRRITISRTPVLGMPAAHCLLWTRRSRGRGCPKAHEACCTPTCTPASCETECGGSDVLGRTDAPSTAIRSSGDDRAPTGASRG